MSNFMGVGIFWIGLNRTDLGFWRLTLNVNKGVESLLICLYMLEVSNVT